jgi:Putative peptidoglycan binding domain
MNSNFRWFLVGAFSVAAVLPVRTQAQVQSNVVRGGNRVNSAPAAHSGPPRGGVAGPSLGGAPIRSGNHPRFNAARFQNFNGAQRFRSMGVGARPSFRPPPRFVAYNLGNQRPATASGTLNLNIATSRIADSKPAPQGAGSNQQLAQANNSNRDSGSARTHVFTHRSAKWHSDWNHDRDHLWHGHLCHFVNNAWIVYDVGFYPWWYYEYPYDYGYAPDSSDSSDTLPSEYDPNGSSYVYASPGANYNDGQNGGGDYDQGQYQTQGETQSDDSSSPADRDIGVETVSGAQDELSREGYYHGPIDGVFSPDTHRAVSDFQKDNGLNVTGYLSRETRNALELDEDADSKN